MATTLETLTGPKQNEKASGPNSSVIRIASSLTQNWDACSNQSISQFVSRCQTCLVKDCKFPYTKLEASAQQATTLETLTGLKQNEKASGPNSSVIRITSSLAQTWDAWSNQSSSQFVSRCQTCLVKDCKFPYTQLEVSAQQATTLESLTGFKQNEKALGPNSNVIRITHTHINTDLWMVPEPGCWEIGFQNVTFYVHILHVRVLAAF